MAEIKIERKKGIPMWALLLALIVLAALAWAFLANRDTRTDAAGTDQAHVIELSAPLAAPAMAPALLEAA